jgi:hypothetical protein
MEIASFKDDEGRVWTEHRHIMQSKGIATWERDDEFTAVTLYRSGKLHFDGMSSFPVEVLHFIINRAEALKKAFDEGTLQWKGSVPADEQGNA